MRVRSENLVFPVFFLSPSSISPIRIWPACERCYGCACPARLYVDLQYGLLYLGDEILRRLVCVAGRLGFGEGIRGCETEVSRVGIRCPGVLAGWVDRSLVMKMFIKLEYFVRDIPCVTANITIYPVLPTNLLKLGASVNA